MGNDLVKRLKEIQWGKSDLSKLEGLLSKSDENFKYLGHENSCDIYSGRVTDLEYLSLELIRNDKEYTYVRFKLNGDNNRWFLFRGYCNLENEDEVIVHAYNPQVREDSIADFKKRMNYHIVLAKDSGSQSIFYLTRIDKVRNGKIVATYRSLYSLW